MDRAQHRRTTRPRNSRSLRTLSSVNHTENHRFAIAEGGLGVTGVWPDYRPAVYKYIPASLLAADEPIPRLTVKPNHGPPQEAGLGSRSCPNPPQ